MRHVNPNNEAEPSKSSGGYRRSSETAAAATIPAAFLLLKGRQGRRYECLSSCNPIASGPFLWPFLDLNDRLNAQLFFRINRRWTRRCLKKGHAFSADIQKTDPDPNTVPSLQMRQEYTRVRLPLWSLAFPSCQSRRLQLIDYGAHLPGADSDAARHPQHSGSASRIPRTA